MSTTEARNSYETAVGTYFGHEFIGYDFKDISVHNKRDLTIGTDLYEVVEKGRCTVVSGSRMAAVVKENGANGRIGLIILRDLTNPAYLVSSGTALEIAIVEGKHLTDGVSKKTAFLADIANLSAPNPFFLSNLPGEEVKNVLSSLNETKGQVFMQLLRRGGMRVEIIDTSIRTLEGKDKRKRLDIMSWYKTMTILFRDVVRFYDDEQEGVTGFGNSVAEMTASDKTNFSK